MDLYEVRVECRERGAIGVFTWLKCYVSAESVEKAARKAFNQRQAEGYETRFVNVVTEFSSGHLADLEARHASTVP